jgi:hypothetical protein
MVKEGEIPAFPQAVVINGRLFFRWDESEILPGPKLRQRLNISGPTLWRWRHAGSTNPPAATVVEWLAAQPSAALKVA